MRIALFVGDVIQAYEAELLEVTARLIEEKGYRLDVFANCFVPNSDFLHIEGLKSVFYLPDLSKYDGILVADDTLHNYNMNEDLRERLKKEAKCPIFSLRNPVENYYFVHADNKELIYNMTGHVLAKHGCNRVGFVTGRMELSDSVERLKGFREAMRDYGVPVREDYIFQGNYWKDQGPETADFFINCKDGLPQAIVCSNDYMALALIQEFNVRGIRVPEDVIVTGMDNIPEGHENVPSLTTIDISVENMVSSAVQALEEIAAGDEEVSKDIVVPGKLIFRASCGCEDVKESVFRNYNTMREALGSDSDRAKDCVYMSIDFGGVINEKDCIRWSMQYFKRAQKFLKSYMVLNKKLVARSQFDWNCDFFDEPVKDGELLPKIFEQELEGGTNVFFPINCKDEVYGYLVAKLDPAKKGYFNEVIAQLLITIGATLKRLEMMHSIGEAKRISYLYLQDPMTQLYNRRGFERKVREVYGPNAENTRAAIASIDLDGLKYVNDNFGHIEGDRLIMTVSDCIEDALREGEFAARFGGDEFAAVILLGENEDKNDFKDRLHEKIREASESFNNYPLSVSVGMAEINSYSDIIEGFKEADREMYAEKKQHHKDMPELPARD